MKTKFIEIVGNASTSAKLGNKYIGHNVNAVAYTDGESVILSLESNGSRVRGATNIKMSKDEYESFCEKQNRPLFVRGIELFGAEVTLG